MGKYIIKVEERAKKELIMHRKSGNIATIKRIETIFKELEDNPYVGIGNPEALKFELTGMWSRRLNRKDRLIYKVVENQVVVVVISAIGHYK